MRIWLDPGKLDTYHVTAGDVIAAIQGQNAQVSVGQLGDLPAVPGQQLNATVTALGRHAYARSSFPTSLCAATPTARHCA